MSFFKFLNKKVVDTLKLFIQKNFNFRKFEAFAKNLYDYKKGIKLDQLPQYNPMFEIYPVCHSILRPPVRRSQSNFSSKIKQRPEY